MPLRTGPSRDQLSAFVRVDRHNEAAAAAAVPQAEQGDQSDMDEATQYAAFAQQLHMVQNCKVQIKGEKRKLPGHGTNVTLREGGGLADIAPTLLELLDLPKPSRMRGSSLVAPVVSEASSGRIAQVAGA